MGLRNESLEIGCLCDSELEESYAIKVQYLDNSPRDSWVAMRAKHPDLFVACRRQEEIIGICYGWPANKQQYEHGTIVLQGIAVAEEFSGNGYGSRLLHFFEHQVERTRGQTVTVASAGGYVDHFYMKNGYEPVAFMICVPAASWCPLDLRTKHHVTADRVDGDMRRLYVDVSDLDNTQRDRLMADFQALEVLAIMEKELASASRELPQ